MSDAPGPTGDFPAGKVAPDDQGGLNLAISNKDGKVFVDFGVSVEWLGFDPQGAADFASALLQHAAQAAAELHEPIYFQLSGSGSSVQQGSGDE